MTVQTLDSNNARARWRDIIDAARAGDDLPLIQGDLSR